MDGPVEDFDCSRSGSGYVFIIIPSTRTLYTAGIIQVNAFNLWSVGYIDRPGAPVCYAFYHVSAQQSTGDIDIAILSV